jgi:hypothetical protein
MSKIVIEDECLAPSKFIYMHYEGPNAFKFANSINKMLPSIFKVNTSSRNEEDMKWDTSKQDHASFFFRFEVNKERSANSRIKFFIKVQGEETLSTSMGRFTIELTARVMNIFERPGWCPEALFKSWWWTYSYLFYDRRRQQHVEICKSWLMTFKGWARDKLNIKGIEVQ